MNVSFIEVNGHYSDETEIRWQKFGVMPVGYDDVQVAEVTA